MQKLQGRRKMLTHSHCSTLVCSVFRGDLVLGMTQQNSMSLLWLGKCFTIHASCSFCSWPCRSYLWCIGIQVIAYKCVVPEGHNWMVHAISPYAVPKYAVHFLRLQSVVFCLTFSCYQCFSLLYFLWSFVLMIVNREGDACVCQSVHKALQYSRFNDLKWRLSSVFVRRETTRANEIKWASVWETVLCCLCLCVHMLAACLLCGCVCLHVHRYSSECMCA